MEKITVIVGLLLALSIASERLVEIIKGLSSWLDTQKPDNSKQERIRRAILQALAVGSGILTAFLAKDYIPKEIGDITSDWAILGLGLLASGGSGLWNSVLGYLSNVKDIKKIELKETRKRAAVS